MVRGIPASLTAIHAVAERFNRSAKNIANLNTDGYKADRVTFAEGPVEGTVQATISVDKSAGPVRAEQTEEGFELVEMSNVDLAKEMVTMMVDKRSIEANLAALKTADELLGTIIDIKS
ncbi:MAG: flagellar biosynthesis protein FlgC [Deltaproteobacteria bacterium]|nr:flagellar biosynthesis protein FlgC [Candidatus Anaeroferrophillus wilburensis]MBN2888143.1 flagellar biosynthesis protein FlgC [Deltaproteobacteria bacterium]